MMKQSKEEWLAACATLNTVRDFWMEAVAAALSQDKRQVLLAINRCMFELKKCKKHFQNGNPADDTLRSGKEG